MMNDLMKVGELCTQDGITSLELVKQVNLFREQEGNRAELKHSDFLKVIRDEFEEEIYEGKFSSVSYKDSKGENRPMFELTTNQSKQVLVRESKFVRKAIIAYIDKLEEFIKSRSTPKTFAEALRLAADKLEENERLQLEMKEQAPKVEYYDELVERGKSFNFRDTAKLLGIKESLFIYFLVDKGYIYRDTKKRLLPIAEYNGKYFETKEFVHGGHNGIQTLVTQEGREHFLKITNHLKTI